MASTHSIETIDTKVRCIKSVPARVDAVLLGVVALLWGSRRLSLNGLGNSFYTPADISGARSRCGVDTGIGIHHQTTPGSSCGASGAGNGTEHRRARLLATLDHQQESGLYVNVGAAVIALTVAPAHWALATVSHPQNSVVPEALKSANSAGESTRSADQGCGAQPHLQVTLFGPANLALGISFAGENDTRSTLGRSTH